MIYNIISFSGKLWRRGNGNSHESQPYLGTKNVVCTTRLKQLKLVNTPGLILLGTVLKTLTPKHLFVVHTPRGTYLTTCLGHSLRLFLHHPTKRSLNVHLLIVFHSYVISDELEDYPDSPVNTAALTREAASSILDSDDTADAMDTGNFPSGSTAPGALGNPSACGSTWTISRSDNVQHEVGDRTAPTLPPIYHTVAKKKLAKMVVRNLNGCAHYETDSTNPGVSVSPPVQVGSFLNKGDNRHNITAHRYDHKNARNLSTSFDPSTLSCIACQGAHRILRRTVEGLDVGLDNPPRVHPD